jgi:guanine deaminase
MDDFRDEWLKQAIALAVENVQSGRGGPFGALVVKDGRVIATGVNTVTATHDPTAHAEVVAIRAACQALSTYQLSGCELYSSCEPCPMCLGAIYWARPKAYYFACTRESAAEAGFDDEFIYGELHLKPEQRAIPGHCMMTDKGTTPFVEWAQSIQKIRY